LWQISDGVAYPLRGGSLKVAAGPIAFDPTSATLFAHDVRADGAIGSLKWASHPTGVEGPLSLSFKKLADVSDVADA
jgi:hypothetical protein